MDAHLVGRAADSGTLSEVEKWLSKLLRKRRKPFSSLPLGVEGELPWHCSVTEARRTLRRLGALSLDVDGFPTARLHWEGLTVRARLEFSSGVYVGESTWLPAHPRASFTTRDGLKVRMEPRLRAANVFFPSRDRRGNWKKALEILGKPTRRLPDGSWLWDWDLMTVRFVEPEPGEEDGVEWLRFASTASSRVLEVRNQSSLELYEKLQVRVDFREGHWLLGDAPEVRGVIVRLHWDVPVGETLLITVSSEDRETSVEVPAKAVQVVITNDGTGGFRVVV